jgi:hypothetical protein
MMAKALSGEDAKTAETEEEASFIDSFTEENSNKYSISKDDSGVSEDIEAKIQQIKQVKTLYY